jgi:phosphatidylethanolamine-binding protein (PEBP) family uncharacterized protein
MYRFKSRADGDLIMMAPVGDQLLRTIGREPAAKGIIEVAALPQAIAALEEAIAGGRAGARRRAQGRRRRRGGRRQRDRPAAARLAPARDDATLARRARRHRLGRLIRRAGPAFHSSEDTMKLWSDSWSNGERIPARYACGRLDGSDGTAFSDNVNPHLAWSDLPPATRSLVLICHDFDVPSRGDDVNQAGREIPADLPRVDFFHWLLADVPVTVRSIEEGALSKGFSPRGKPGPAVTAPDSNARARASTTSPAGSPATRRSRATTSATTARTRRGTTRSSTTTCSRSTPLGGTRAGRGPLRRRRAAQGDRRARPRRAMHSGTYTLNRRLG